MSVGLSINAYNPIIWQTTTSTRASNGVYKDDANLVSLWLFENGADLGEDSIGSNDLTNNASVSQSSDQKEGTYSADFEVSSSQYLNIADGSQSGLDITGDEVSICAWVKLESYPAYMYLAGKYGSTSNGTAGYALMINSSQKASMYLSNTSDAGSSATDASGTTTISTGTWFHLCAVYNGTDIRIYVDGSIDTSATNPEAKTGNIHDTSADFMIGNRDYTGGLYDGLMDEVAVFNRALSADEVSDIYNNGIRAVPTDVTSQLYPKFGETLQTEKEQYTITDGIGFDVASFDLSGPIEYLQDWFVNGLVRHIVWKGPNDGVCWEGYVNRLVLSFGDRAITKSIEGMYNQVILRYTALDATQNPPVAGAQKTVTINDTTSQDRYGIKATNQSGAEATDATADDLARSHLNANKHVVSTEVVSVGQGREPSLRVEMRGYAHMANWLYYTQTTNSSTANANTVVGAIVAADDNGSLDTTTINIDTNATATEQYWDGKTRAWDVIKEIADRGVEAAGIGYRWHCGVYERRRVTFKASEGLDDDLKPYDTNKHLVLNRQQMDASDAFIDEAGREWMPWEIRPDRLIRTQGVRLRPMYVTQVKMTMPWNITLQGSDRTNPISGLTHIVNNLDRSLRADFFAKDRDVYIQTTRTLVLADGTEIPDSALVPIGGIILWSGSVASIPTGWQLCNGTNGTPDLRNRFVVGAGSTYSVDATGGSTTKDIRHTHGAGSYATDSDGHSHSAGSLNADATPGTYPQATSGANIEVISDTHQHDISGTTGSDTHSHDVTGTSSTGGSSSQNILPPYYALAYIQRLT